MAKFTVGEHMNAYIVTENGHIYAVFDTLEAATAYRDAKDQKERMHGDNASQRTHFRVEAFPMQTAEGFDDDNDL